VAVTQNENENNSDKDDNDETESTINAKINCYKSLIKPVLEYACAIWDPYLQKDILAVEAVQRRCARFVHNNYSSYASVTNMLENLKWPSLAQCRTKVKAITMFKIMHQLLDIPTDGMPYSNQLHPTSI